MDHVLLVSSHYEGKAREKKRPSVQGAITVTYIVVDKHGTTAGKKPRPSSVIRQQRPLPLEPPSQGAPPPHPPHRTSLPPNGESPLVMAYMLGSQFAPLDILVYRYPWISLDISGTAVKASSLQVDMLCGWLSIRLLMI